MQYQYITVSTSIEDDPSQALSQWGEEGYHVISHTVIHDTIIYIMEKSLAQSMHAGSFIAQDWREEVRVNQELQRRKEEGYTPPDPSSPATLHRPAMSDEDDSSM